MAQETIIGNKPKPYPPIVVIVSAKENPSVNDSIVTPSIIFPIASKNPEATTIGKKKEIAVIKCFLKPIDFSISILFPFHSFIQHLF